MVRFSLNVSTLFTKSPLLDRFDLAADAGFVEVESWWPEQTDPDAYIEAVVCSGLDLVLLNFFGGSLAEGDRGVLGDLERAHEFRENVPIALEVARRLGCNQPHALIGKAAPGQSREEQLRLAVENVRWAADLAGRQGATVLVEPLSDVDSDGYLLRGVEGAKAFIREVCRVNVGLQFDTYHIQRTNGDPGSQVRACAGVIRHVQIADEPGRGRPGTGAIDFVQIFTALERIGLPRWVGLEYLARSGTAADLEWFPRELRRGRQSYDAVRALLARAGVVRGRRT